MSNRRTKKKIERVGTSRPSLYEMAGKWDNLGVRSASMPGSQFFHQHIMFSVVANAVRWFDVCLAVRSTSYEGHHMIEIQNMVRENRLPTYMAPSSVTLKNPTVTYFFGLPAFFEGVASHVLFFGFHFVGKVVFMVFLSSMFCSCLAVFFAPNAPFFSGLRIVCIAFSCNGIPSFTIAIAFIVVARISSHLFAISHSFSILFAKGFGVCSTPRSFIGLRAILTIEAISIFCAFVLGKAFERLCYWRIATRADFRWHKQRQLDSVIQWGHSFASPFQMYSLENGSVTSIPIFTKLFPHSTTNQPLMQLYSTQGVFA